VAGIKCFGFFVKMKVNIVYLIVALAFDLLVSFAPAYASSGKYLVASEAVGNKDFDRAASSYLSILELNSADTVVLQEALIFSILADDLDSAWGLSSFIEKNGFQISSSGLVAIARSLKDADFDRVQSLSAKYEKSLPKFLILFVNGWTEIARGNFDSGISMFKSLDGTMRYLALFNCAVAHAMNGDFVNAALYLKEVEEKNLQLNERQLRAQAQIYSNNDEIDKAILLLQSNNLNLNNNLFRWELNELKNGNRIKFDAFESAPDALANIFYLMGSSSDEENSNSIAAIFYIQLAEFMSEEKDYYNLRLAETFARMQAHKYSTNKYKKVPNKSIFYLKAQLGIVDTLVEKNQNDQGAAVLQTLIKQGFNEFALFDSLADIFRAKEDYETAIKYYNKALGKFDGEIIANKWATFFVRGISHDQSGNWEQAKVDLSTALTLYPNHPEVLNYFGYSLIERNESLDKALGMIEDAVAQKPESGYIIDSLAWGLFRLGHYNEAIVPMEKAVELEPHDPIVNDHLGDILWMIGRKREARFQWNRALLFGPTEENKKKIKKKLRLGLTDL